MFVRTLLSVLLCLCFCAHRPVVVHAEPGDTNYDESKVPDYELPDPLLTLAGERVTTAAAWRNQRRPEILRLFEQHVYGRTPQGGKRLKIRAEVREQSGQALGGLATRRQVRIGFGDAASPTMDLLLYLPNQPQQPVPTFLGLNFYGNQTVHADPAIEINRGWMRGNAKIGIVEHRATEKTRGVYTERWHIESLLKKGYAVVTVYSGDIDPDSYNSDFSDGVHPLFYAPGQTKPKPDEWGTIGAWAWGLSRALDYLETEDRIDAQRVALIGHSRLGKTALWAGAQDERFALVISNMSGCGGAALFRRCYGERIHHMTRGAIRYWFCENHAKFAEKEQELPVDQHMLIALMAPRPVYVASAEKDRWADPRGEFLAAKHASVVYALFGKQGLPATKMPGLDQPVFGTLGYHCRRGGHEVEEYDWQQYVRFAEMHLK